MTVATYEPLILRWVSGYSLLLLSNIIVKRAPKARFTGYRHGMTTAIALSKTIRRPLPVIVPGVSGQRPEIEPMTRGGQPVRGAGLRPEPIAGFPNAFSYGGSTYYKGVNQIDPAGYAALKPRGGGLLARLFGWPEPPRLQPQLVTTPITVNGISDQLSANGEGDGERLYGDLMQAARTYAEGPDLYLGTVMKPYLTIGGVDLPWLGGARIEEQLSPIGIAHYFRQLYFHVEEGVGPLEQAFTIAPLETLEVMYQTVRRQTHEEVLERGLEVVSDGAIEEKNLDEVSDKVSSMIQTDTSAAMSASVSGGVGVWSASSTASGDMSLSSQSARELSTRRLKEVTKRASERITKSFTVTTRDVTEMVDTSMTRRVIRNDSPEPVSYGLRRVLRRVRVKVQDLGPRLVWQTYVRNPGDGLALSRFVHFREAAPLTAADLPPGVPSRPAGGTDSGSAQCAIRAVSEQYFVVLTITPGPDRWIEAVRIDSLKDLDAGGKEDRAPAPLNEIEVRPSHRDPDTGNFTAFIAVLPGDSTGVEVQYTYRWVPTEAAILGWEAQRAAGQAAATEEALQRQFERNKALITQRSKIKARPANELRREERYEVMNRLVSHLFARGDDGSEPSPLEIEYFHRYFDIDAIFTWLHPSWWKPRFSGSAVGMRRGSYEITAESEPAPLGSSLGWLLQEDGDDRRSEFLNSPWVRVCVPIRAGHERAAIAWLAEHVEGEAGYDPSRDPLRGLLRGIEKRRAAESGLGQEGPDYVEVISTPGAPADPASPEGVFPIIDEFDVTLPTEGFVYDRLTVST
jgi:hypothetical protein